MAVVYKIKNELNGEFYIGFTSKNPPEKRFSEHKSNSRRGRKGYLYNAMRKDGHDNFSFTILESTNDDGYARKVLEPRYIAELRPKYNMTDGGEGRSGYMLSEGSRMKISKAQRNVADGPMRAEHKLAISKSLLNSEKFRTSMRYLGISRKGIPRPLEVQKKIRAMNDIKIGKPRLLSTKKKISETLTGRSNGPHVIVTCPHCRKIGGNNVMPRWHFNNCKIRRA
jgi:group I intron endonuclease